MGKKKRKKLLEILKGGLIVSCQALSDEPLHSSFVMGRMAKAAEEGGAVAIRANSPEDIMEIKKVTSLPVIGLWKVVYPDSKVYITPTMSEIDALVASGADIIALDATDRLRPGVETLQSFFTKVREKYENVIFMADCSTYEDGVRAEYLGFDIVSTTLCGYTDDTKGKALPDLETVERLAKDVSVPVIAEGGIWERSDLQRAFKAGAYAAVIGTAITRPREITKRFVDAIKEQKDVD